MTYGRLAQPAVNDFKTAAYIRGISRRAMRPLQLYSVLCQEWHEYATLLLSRGARRPRLTSAWPELLSPQSDSPCTATPRLRSSESSRCASRSLPSYRKLLAFLLPSRNIQLVDRAPVALPTVSPNRTPQENLRNVAVAHDELLDPR
jgi:hypothetical protein